MAIQRSIAYKVWISDIFSGNYVKQEGFNPNYVELDGKQISRVNVLATVVGKFMSDDGNYGAVTLDDGTDTIRIKAFGPDVIRIQETEIGKLVRAVGKIKEYNDERYLAPDFVSEITDPNWLTVWKLTLGEPKPTKAPKPIVSQATPEDSIDIKPTTETTPTQENTAIETPKTEENNPDLPNLLEIISKLDSGEGAEIDSVIAECKLSEAEAKIIIVDLLKQGEIYEPRKGKLKVL